ncbi:hypothetical protein B0H16DRAFT_523934 [Mycena metata]|uniref:Uncharacterized protein n=1 Tax=Mycena metata TaxID=1033252 RepID=A0AAD7H7P6_9AGAR|nr:hypothetical protein B0H16DRAFT_523934 [Mycena metata]
MWVKVEVRVKREPVEAAIGLGLSGLGLGSGVPVSLSLIHSIPSVFHHSRHSYFLHSPPIPYPLGRLRAPLFVSSRVRVPSRLPPPSLPHPNSYLLSQVNPTQAPRRGTRARPPDPSNIAPPGGDDGGDDSSGRDGGRERKGNKEGTAERGERGDIATEGCVLKSQILLAEICTPRGQ